MVVTQLLEDRQGFLLTDDRVLVPPATLVGDAEAVEAGGLAPPVAQLPEDGQAPPPAGDRMVVATKPLLDHSEAAQAVGLALTVTQLPEGGQALPESGRRLVVAAQPSVGDAEVAVRVGLTGPVLRAEGYLQGDLVGPHGVLPVAPHLEQPEHGAGELAGQPAGIAGAPVAACVMASSRLTRSVSSQPSAAAASENCRPSVVHRGSAVSMRRSRGRSSASVAQVVAV